MRVSIIVAVAANGVIGRDNNLPWRLATDLKRFKSLTMGHHLLMGRRTFESIGRALPGRTTVVISRGRPDLPDGVLMADSVETAIDLARRGGDSEAFIAGGAEIYALALPMTDRIYLTRIDASIKGDTYFPELVPTEWEVRHQEHFAADDSFAWPHSYQILERSSSAESE